MRSAATSPHQGHSKVTPDDVYVLANMVMGSLLTIAARRDEFHTTSELADRVDGQRLS